MFENICEIIFILLSIAGIVYIWKNFLLFILKNKNDKGIYVIVPISNNCENLEQLVRSAAEKTLLMGNNQWDKVVCVDYDNNEDSKKIVDRLCKEYSFLYYMTDKTFKSSEFVNKHM